MKKQDLSPTAAKAKAERDKEYMMGPYKKKTGYKYLTLVKNVVKHEPEVNAYS